MLVDLKMTRCPNLFSINEVLQILILLSIDYLSSISVQTKSFNLLILTSNLVNLFKIQIRSKFSKTLVQISKVRNLQKRFWETPLVVLCCPLGDI